MADQHNGRPHVACEVSGERVIAARANRGLDSLEAFRSYTLPAGTVTPALLTENIPQKDALRQTISDSLMDVAARSRDVIAILPDAAVRVVLLDFDTLPERPKDAVEVVRFRLKKALPFDIDKAAVSYDVQRTAMGMRVIAAVTLATVLAEYEAAFRDAGYNPGVVMPATIASLGAFDGRRPTLMLKVDTATTSVAIVDNNQLLLLRTLENTTAANVTGDRLAEDIYPSLVFFKDTHGTDIERVLVTGVPSLEEVAPALESQTGAKVQELVSPAVSQGIGKPSVLSAVVGALIG